MASALLPSSNLSTMKPRMRAPLIPVLIPCLLLAGLTWMSAQRTSAPPPASICLEVPSPQGTTRGVGDSSLLWHKTRLSVKWMGGSPELRQKVETYAREWEQFCPIRFNFGVRFGSGDIRIDFSPSGGSWSYVGIEAQTSPGNEPTMNLAIDDSTEEAMIKRVVLHEFGHALGLRHEHRSPNKPFSWDVDAVMETYAAAGWSSEKTIMNVLENIKDPNATLRASDFDPKSIMLYPIPATLTGGTFSADWNLELSDGDKEFIARIYNE